ncbi:MAG: DUF4139 domain-containing protein [Phycisphaeraceae bacterium]|nr:DUF4139 domain-containing protein [Phycisphaeraceae bacterium]
MSRPRIAMFSIATTLLLGATALGAPTTDSQAEEPATSVTIYSSADPAGFDPQRFIGQQRNGGDFNFASQVPGFGVVRQTRSFELRKGLNEVSFTDVAAFLDPTSVGFRDLTDPRTAVLEQAFKFDLVSPSKLLEKYLDEQIEITVTEGDGIRIIAGELLSSSQGRLVIKTDTGLEMVDASDARISLGSLPDGFLTKPTLVWMLDAARGGSHEIRSTYQTAGLTWRADYNLVLNDDDTAADVTAWVSLLNVSGIAYPNAKLKLVAGDVQKIQPARQYRAAAMEMARDGMVGKAAGFEESSLFEYHLYTLPRTTTIARNSTQQLTLFPAVSGVEIAKELLYDPTSAMGWNREPYMNPGFVPGGADKVGVYVSFKNDTDNGLGVPLPKGRIRAYKQDAADGSLEFVGEDLIDHTPRNEEVRIKLGNAFDVVGERRVVDFKIDKARKTMSETIELEVRNQKDAVQTVVIREHLYRWRNWEMTERNLPFERIDANTIEWKVDVAPEGEKTIRYTVRYTW